jgi:hypothetical protein
VRQSLRHTKKKLGQIKNAVEIGVRDGRNAVGMLNSGVEFLYLVDPYIEYEETWDYDEKEINRKFLDRKFQDKCKSLMLGRITQYKDKIEFLEVTSVEAAKRFQDKEFDYVYIDGNHDYEFVKLDLEVWFPKVRDGGVLAGHDFNKPKQFPGITKAVIEFAKKNNFKVVYNQVDSDWWINK